MKVRVALDKTVMSDAEYASLRVNEVAYEDQDTIILRVEEASANDLASRYNGYVDVSEIRGANR